MITSIDKALVAALLSLASFLAAVGIDPPWLTNEFIQGIAAVMTPVLVWWIPNKS